MVIYRSAQTLAIQTPMTLRKPCGLNVASVEGVVVRAAAKHSDLEDGIVEEELPRFSSPQSYSRKKSLPHRQRASPSPPPRRRGPPPRREPLPGVAISLAPPHKRGRVPVDYYHMDPKQYNQMR